MNKRRMFLCLAAVFALILTGCSLRTLDSLYQVPKRSEQYNNLQSAIDQNLGSREYCAPLSGDNLQAIQMVDLDGDGNHEYLLFAKGTSEKPLQILVFRPDADGYVLSDIIYHHGSAFDMIEYAQIDELPGYEIIVGCKISDQVARSVSVYSYHDGKITSQMNANYTAFLTCDMDVNGRSELMILRTGETEQENGIAELYSHTGASLERLGQAELSYPASQLERVIVGKLQGDKNAVYASGATAEGTVITDVFVMIDGQLSNLTHAGTLDTMMPTS